MTARPTRAVIVTIGATDGFAWELDPLARAGHLRKTTFLVPPVPDADTWARWAFTSGELVPSLAHRLGRTGDVRLGFRR